MNKIKNTSIIAAFALTLTASAFAGTSPHEENRQLLRGSGLADSVITEAIKVHGKKASAYTISRHARTASQREAFSQEAQPTMSSSAPKEAIRQVTAFRNNRNS